MLFLIIRAGILSSKVDPVIGPAWKEGILKDIPTFVLIKDQHTHILSNAGNHPRYSTLLGNSIRSKDN